MGGILYLPGILLLMAAVKGSEVSVALAVVPLSVLLRALAAAAARGLPMERLAVMACLVLGASEVQILEGLQEVAEVVAVFMVLAALEVTPLLVPVALLIQIPVPVVVVAVALVVVLVVWALLGVLVD